GICSRCPENVGCGYRITIASSVSTRPPVTPDEVFGRHNNPRKTPMWGHSRRRTSGSDWIADCHTRRQRYVAAAPRDGHRHYRRVDFVKSATDNTPAITKIAAYSARALAS